MYPSTFGHVTSWFHIKYRPNESSIPKQQRKQFVSAVYGWRKVSDKNLEQWISIRSDVRIGNARETLALIKLNYDE
jgi:hypothetical protein